MDRKWGKNSGRLIHTTFPMARLNIVFKSTHRISKWFKFKDSIPQQLRSKVVYKFRCTSCSATYIGQTTRHLKTRISEHRGLSPRTGKALGNPNFSSIREHCLDTGHDFSVNDFEVIATGRDKYELKILESLLIKHYRPKLNNMLCSSPLQLFDGDL